MGMDTAGCITRRTLTDAQINRELLDVVFRTPMWWVVLVSVLGLIVAGAASAFGFMMNQGLGVTGLQQPIFWGFFITNFVFWVGISHAGVMISAILRLSQAEWRRPMVRAAETMTVFALMVSLLQPLITQDGPGASSTGCSPTTGRGASGPTCDHRSYGTRPPSSLTSRRACCSCTRR